MSIVASNDWDIPFTLDSYCQSELRFWLHNIQDVSARKYQESPLTSKTIYSDTSSRACGALLVGTDHVAHRMFTAVEQAESSTFRELLAVQFGINSFKPIIRGCNVKWFSDNKSTMTIARVGSMTLKCHQLAIEIFSVCFTAGIQLDIEWIPRAENTRADYISKFIDYDDWEITMDTFAILEHRFGPHTLDCFANCKNAKVKKFFSRFWNPGSAGIDAFYQDWSGENCLVVPPIPIVARVIKLMFHNGFKGTLVVPYWTSASYWPLIAHRFLPNVKDRIIFPGNDALTQGINKKSLLGSPAWTGEVFAGQLDFHQRESGYLT